jgi:spermidine synthase
MMTESLKSNDVIFSEMMSHPVLFSHHNPKTVSIIDDENDAILCEVLKHTRLMEIQLIKKNNHKNAYQDPRIKSYDSAHGIPSSSDIIITLSESTPELLSHYFNQLTQYGILIQVSASPFDIQPLKTLVMQLKNTGFCDIQTLHFPQPTYPSGWRLAMLALKQGVFKRVREKDIFNKSFKTHYYNFDIHCASLVLPEFMRETIT